MALQEVLLDILQKERENLLHEWVEEFSVEEQEEEYRYYNDFLGFFEECVKVGLNFEAEETKDLIYFLEKFIEIKSDELFFDMNKSIYSCQVKFPILRALKDRVSYEELEEVILFFDKVTGEIVRDLIKRDKELQASAMDELEEREAPIAKVWENTIMVSIVGTLDSNRVLKIMDKILDRLEHDNIDYVIIDIGSIYQVDNEVARQLMKLNNAVHFMGSTAYLTGITPVIAKNLTHLELNLGDVKTFSNTQKAMENIINVQRSNRSQ